MDEEEAFKDAIERYNSIEIIHDAGQDSVEIPNMRPEQPKRKKFLKILPRVSGEPVGQSR